MNFRYHLILFAILIGAQGARSQQKDVLLNVNGKPITSQEFVRVYNKNLDLVQDERQKTIDGYLDLFIDFKLKVEEAYDQGLHREPQFVREFSKYEEELSRKYIYEAADVKDMAREAYQRSLEDREVSHILIKVGLDAAAKDTVAAYNKIREIRQKALNGEDFKELARKFSEEPGAKERAGYLGYFSAFRMVYPFETAAYKTPKGAISEIVRTQFGYHVLKVHDVRQRAGDRTVSHIMTMDRPADTSSTPARERILEIKQLLDQGEDFAQLARKYSEDKGSAVNGGKLKRFNRGQLRSEEFEKMAYQLEKPGQISEPFQTSFGWHIMRLEEVHPVETFEQKRAELEKLVARGDRARVVSNTINQEIKKLYGFEKGQPFLEYFEDYLPDSILTRKYRYDSLRPVEKRTLFKLGDRTYTFEDFAKYLEVYRIPLGYYKSKEPLLNAAYEEFETRKLKQYFREELERTNLEYAGIIDEYRNGLLIYELMNRNIWTQAKTDSVGLEAHYQRVKDQFRWGERVEATVVSATSREAASKARTLLEEGKTAQAIKETLNSKEKLQVLVDSGKFERGDRKLPEQLPFKEGISDIYNTDGSFVVVKIEALIPPSVKALDETRGRVLNSYQNYLEEKWMEELREKYDVQVDKRVLRKLKKEISN